MITKETFCTIINEADKYFNGRIYEALKHLEITENAIGDIIDEMVAAIDHEIDPDRKARDDEYCWDCGSFIWMWICTYGENVFRDKICPTAADLYDYIIKAYKNN